MDGRELAGRGTGPSVAERVTGAIRVLPARIGRGGRVTGAAFLLQATGGFGPPSGETLQAVGTVEPVCPYCRGQEAGTC